MLLLGLTDEANRRRADERCQRSVRVEREVRRRHIRAFASHDMEVCTPPEEDVRPRPSQDRVGLLNEV